MLDGINDVPWSELWHAHGSAEDVPSMLVALQNPDSCLEACADLHETVWHQGTIYPASAATLPFLFQIIQSSPKQRESFSPDHLAVGLIAAIALGEGWVQARIRTLGEEGAREQMKKMGRNFTAESQLEADTLLTIRQSVVSNRDTLAKYRDEDEGLGEMVSELLSAIESGN